MTPALGILCYHRIVRDDDDGSWPYLERGTGVRSRTLARHIADLTRFADIVGEDVALAVLARRHELARPAVWMTFDDGYRDVIAVLPLIETATVFVATRALTHLLPADAWYALLLAANRRRGVLDLGLGPFDFDLTTAAGRARLVHGPERRAFLRAGATTQATTLADLARQLDAGPTEARPYLTVSELRSVVAHRWSVGSHGVTHTPLDTLAPDAIRHEASASRDLLRALGSIRSLALPDGAVPDAGALRAVGYECVLGLGDAPASAGLAVQTRYLVPDDPAWTSRVLEPALTGGAGA